MSATTDLIIEYESADTAGRAALQRQYPGFFRSKPAPKPLKRCECGANFESGWYNLCPDCVAVSRGWACRVRWAS